MICPGSQDCSILDEIKRGKALPRDEMAKHLRNPNCRECIIGTIKCPKCGSKELSYCPGSTNLTPIPDSNWICMGCLFEF